MDLVLKNYNCAGKFPYYVVTLTCLKMKVDKDFIFPPYKINNPKSPFGLVLLMVYMYVCGELGTK